MLATFKPNNEAGLWGLHLRGSDREFSQIDANGKFALELQIVNDELLERLIAPNYAIENFFQAKHAKNAKNGIFDPFFRVFLGMLRGKLLLMSNPDQLHPAKSFIESKQIQKPVPMVRGYLRKFAGNFSIA